MSREWELTIERDGTIYHLCEERGSWPDYFVHEDWSLAWVMGETYGPIHTGGPNGGDYCYISKGPSIDPSDIEEEAVVQVCDTHLLEPDLGR